MTINFRNEEHQEFYNEKMKEVRYRDCYHEALIYTLGICADTRQQFERIYDLKSGLIKPKCLHEGWQTGSSLKVVRLAFNLYTDVTPTKDLYRKKDEMLRECNEYSVSNIFCSNVAPYFWQAIQIRYPEYCKEESFNV